MSIDATDARKSLCDHPDKLGIAVLSSEPGRLTGMLRSDLDLVVMNALEQDRGGRYETASADIRRYLAGEAVLAVPPGRLYRLRKYLRLLVGSDPSAFISEHFGMVMWDRRSGGFC